MEEQQVQLTEEQFIAKLMAEAEAAQQAAPQQAAPQQATAAVPTLQPLPAKGKRKSSPYRYWALLLAGLFCYALLIVLAALAWGSLIFARQGDVGEGVAMPLAIFLGSVFLSCFLITLLSRGGTIFPALGLALIVNIIPLLLPDAPEPQPKAIAIKLGYTLIVAIVGFALSKALYIRGKKPRGA